MTHIILTRESEAEQAHYVQSLDYLVDDRLPLILRQRDECEAAALGRSDRDGPAKFRQAEAKLQATQKKLMEDFTKAGGTEEQLQKMVLNKMLYSTGPYAPQMKYEME